MIVPLGDFTPDLAEISASMTPRLRDAKGCLPLTGSYAPLRSLSATTGALTAKCIGAIATRAIDQTAHIYAGDSSKLYELVGLTWTDVSKSGGYGPVSAATRWRFAAYGDRLIAVNGWYDNVQYKDMSGVSDFADLGGSPGKAQFVAQYSEFVFLAALQGEGMTLKWSGFGDSAGWTPGTNQSDEQELADGGRITGLIGASTLLVFQERAIRRVLYTGGEAIMDIQKVSETIGCIEPGSLIYFGRLAFFLSEDGWYSMDLETFQLAPIGAGKFDLWFEDDCNHAARFTMSAAIDPHKKIVVVSYASTSSTASPDSLFFYNWGSGRPAYARFATEYVFSAVSAGISLDDLTGIALDTDAPYSTLSLDDPFFYGGRLYLGAFNTDHKLASFAGDAVEATFQTDAFPLLNGQRARLEWLKPIADTTAATMAGGAQVRPGDPISFVSAVAQQISGRCPQRGVNGFYSAAKLVIPAGSTWTYASGLEVKANPAGMR